MRLPVVQGVYFLLTGVWPLLSIRTFEAVTGPKVDRWLVKTVGLLVAVIGASLLAEIEQDVRGLRDQQLAGLEEGRGESGRLASRHHS